ncbi:MAG: fasciclin domain-containing protein [Pseudomonadota bacterium]
MSRALTFAASSSIFLLLMACGGPDPASDAAEQTSSPVEAESETSGEEEAPAMRSMAELLRDEPRLSSLAAAVEAAGMTDQLSSEGPYTLFAPSNDAFAALPSAVSLDILSAPENSELLKTIISYHVVPMALQRDDLGAEEQLSTLSGAPLPVTINGSIVAVGNEAATALIVIPNLEVANGVIHIVDSVLLPPAN